MKILKVIQLILFALWWGGFTFYASWVIPTAHTVLGDKVITGLITQKVSIAFNILLALFIFSSLVQFIKEGTWRIELLHIVIFVAMVIGLIVLLYLHARLDRLLMPEALIKNDKQPFYAIHRVYLWTSTLLWCDGLAWLIHTQTVKKN